MVLESIVKDFSEKKYLYLIDMKDSKELTIVILV
jgi:hypothetical protein